MATRRRWLRFSLRGFLVVLTIGCLWLGWKVEKARRRGRAIDAVIAAGGKAIYGGSTQEAIHRQDHFWSDLASRRVGIFFHEPLDRTLGTYLSDINGIIILHVSVESDNDLQYLEGLNDVDSVVCHDEGRLTREGLMKLHNKLPNTTITTVDWRGAQLTPFRP
jgi:hypothetical protein